jgi:extracellular factor (EF) 3-hydroxypalmitic acid methyl ester biosynthesis protein
MTASLQAETTNQVIDQITLTKRSIDQILDRTMELVNQGDSGIAISSLFFRLGKLSAKFSCETFQDWIRDYCTSHPIAEILWQSPITKRCFSKPKGYAGDATLIDYIYLKDENIEFANEIAEILHKSICNSTSCDSVRERAKYFGNLITQISESKNRKISAISIASGHLRELDHVSHFEDKVYHFIGLDQDAESNTEARRSYPFKGLTVLDESIKYVLAGKLEAESYDLVYSAGLFDYLDEKVAARMTKRMFELVVPGGTMVIPNFAKGIIERGYMETFMDWYLIYRDEMELYGFMKELDMSQVASWNIHGDKYGNILYLTVVKKG